MINLFNMVNAVLKQRYESRQNTFNHLLSEVGSLMVKTMEEPQRVVWTSTYSFPVEIIHAFDLLPFDAELFSSLLTLTGVTEKLLDEGEALGYPKESCSYHRLAYGALMKDYYPKPAIIIGITFFCDGKGLTMNLVSSQKKIPSYILDVPYKNEKEDVEYVYGQLLDICEILSKKTGIKNWMERIEKHVEITDMTFEVFRKAQQFQEMKPFPYRGRKLFPLILMSTLFLGTETALKIANEHIEEVSQNAKHPEKWQEKFRLFWMQAIPSYKNIIFDLLEKKYGANIVGCETFLPDTMVKEKDPLKKLAMRTVDSWGPGSGARRLEKVLPALKRFSADGVIHFNAWTCRNFSGMMGYLKKQLQEQAGIPVLFLDGDLLDARNYQEEQMRTRLEGFMEILEGR